MDGALQPRLVLIGLAVHIVLGAAVDYDGMCAAGTFSPEAAYQAACHKPENISVRNEKPPLSKQCAPAWMCSLDGTDAGCC